RRRRHHPVAGHAQQVRHHPRRRGPPQPLQGPAGLPGPRRLMAPLPRRRQAPRRTLVIGEALVDVVVAPDGSRTEHVGGSPLNVSVGLARLGYPVTLAAHIGRDERGADIGARLSEAGVLLVPGSDSAEDTSVATATLDEP